MRRRPNRTIDLTATEVAMGDDDDAAMPKDSAQPAAATASEEIMQESSTSHPAPPPPDPQGGSGGSGQSSNERPRSREDWLPARITWPLLEAGAAGGGLVLLVLAALWFAGVLTPRDNRLSDVNARLAQNELQLKQIAAAPGQPGADPKALEALSARLAKLEAVPAQPTPPDPALAQRLAAAEEAIKSSQATVAELNKRAEATADAARSASGVERGDIDALSNRLAALEKSTKSVADDLDKRIAALGDRPLRLAVAAQALRDAVERGDAFASELAAVKAVGADANMLAPLDPFANTGVPSPATLARELSGVLPAMQRLATPPAEGGFLDKLQTNASRLVRVRPIDDVPGDDPAAVLARIDSKAGRSDIAGALAEFAKLPPGTRTPAEDWIKKAEARNAAMAASRRLAREALAALGKSTP
jgi:hypothetical protein